MERLRQETKEILQKDPFDAVLIHGYWLSGKKPEDTRLALRSRLATRAGALAYDNGRGAKKIVVSLGHFWGKDYPSEASLMLEELTNKYNVPPEDIIWNEESFSTGGEVSSFLDMADQNGWNNLLDVAFSTHHSTIPMLYRGTDKRINFNSVESIINQRDNPHVKRLVQRLGRSKYEWTYKLYELGKRVIYSLPNFDPDKLEQVNRAGRTKPHESWIQPIDVYRMPESTLIDSSEQSKSAWPTQDLPTPGLHSVTA